MNPSRRHVRLFPPDDQLRQRPGSRSRALRLRARLIVASGQRAGSGRNDEQPDPELLEHAPRCWLSARPDDRPALGFFAALGFTPDAGPDSRKLYGVPAFVDWDGPGEDRVLLDRAISGQ